MSDTQTLESSAAVDVATLLDEPAARPPWKRPLLWAAAALLAAALAGGWAWQARKIAAAAPSYVTEPVTRGQLSVVVSANGTLQPTHSVNIGSELSGTVARVNVDVNDP